MKKFLLIAVAAITMMSANAQMRVSPKANHEAQAKGSVANVLGIKDNAVKTYAQKAEPGTSVSVMRPQKVGANQAKYYRPRGTFYVNWDNEGGAFYMPFLQTRPFEELTFTNASTANMAGSTWTYWDDQTDEQEFTEYTFQGQDFTHYWGSYNYPPTPRLSIPRVDSAYVCTQGAKVNRTTGKIEAVFYGDILSVSESRQGLGGDLNSLASPHYYGSTNRAYNTPYGFTAYTGATPVDGEEDGWWFGRNAGPGNNGFATAVEAPAQPYVLNRVYGYISWLKGTGEFDITCRVYRLDEMPQYGDECNVLDPMMFDDDHLIAKGTTTVTETNLEDGYAILPFDLEAYNADLDMDIEVTPEIDFPIIIVMSGYDVPECQQMSFLITTDQEDEGYGEMAYMLDCAEDGTITACNGLNNLFYADEAHTSMMEMKPGTSIFLDVSLPYMLYNFLDETGEYTFPNEGGNYVFGDHEGVYILCSSHADDIYVELEDGSEVPDWLTIVLEDETVTQEGVQYYTGAVDAKVTCAALPDGVSGREAKVKFYINGAKLIYDFKQGDVVEPQPAKVYLIGDAPLGGWNPEAPIEMTENEETEGVFTYTVNVEEAKDIYFVFTEGIGSWDEVNGHRYGPTEANQDVVVGEDMTTQLSTNDQAAYKLAAVAGEYTFTFNKNTMTFRVDGGVAPEPDYKLHYGHEGVDWQDATFVPGEGENEGKLVVADLAFEANTEFGVKYGETWFAGLPNEGEDNYVIHYDWCTDIPLSTGDNVKNFLINEAGTYTFLLTVGEEGNTLTVTGLVAPGVPGDSNGDGVVDISDVNSVINQMLGKEDMIPACDMNGDGIIDISDVNAVINKMLGK